MLHGHLPAALVPEHEAISSSQLVKALVVSLVAAGFVYWLLAHAPVVAGQHLLKRPAPDRVRSGLDVAEVRA